MPIQYVQIMHILPPDAIPRTIHPTDPGVNAP